MILSDYATTGDGLIAALQVLAVLVEDGRPASEVARVSSRRCRNGCGVSASTAPRRSGQPSVRAAIDAATDRLNGYGRLLIRESGTEPVVRVMAEAEDEALVVSVVEELCIRIQNVG